jgi:hypothetical protein
MKERTMTDNVTPFPNADEVFDTVEQGEADYCRAFDLGYTQGQEAKKIARAMTEGMNEDEKAGFWDGFHDM